MCQFLVSHYSFLTAAWSCWTVPYIKKNRHETWNSAICWFHDVSLNCVTFSCHNQSMHEFSPHHATFEQCNAQTPVQCKLLELFLQLLAEGWISEQETDGGPLDAPFLPLMLGVGGASWSVCWRWPRKRPKSECVSVWSSWLKKKHCSVKRHCGVVLVCGVEDTCLKWQT